MKRKEKYSDIIEYIETRLALENALIEAAVSKDFYKKEFYKEIAAQRQKEIERWLETDA